MVCNNCGKEITAEMSICPNCGVDLPPVQKPKKGMPKAVQIILVLLVIGLAIGIICGILYDPVKDVKKGHFVGMNKVTVGEMFDAAFDNEKWYSKSEDGNTLVYCEGDLFGDKVQIPLVKEDGNVYYFEDKIKVNGKTVSSTEAGYIINSIYTYYMAMSS